MRVSAFSAIGLGLWLASAVARAGEDGPLVEIRQYAFHPPELTVKAGTTVRWENRERRQYHNVWFEQLDAEEPDYLFPGERYERRFDRPGDYPYRCGPHPEMIGIIHVIE